MRARFSVIPATVVVATLIAPLPGAEAQVAPRLVDATGLEWLFTNDVVADAAYTGAVAADKAPTGSHLAVLADAFDGYGGITIAVDGGAATAYSAAWAGVTECNGRQMVLPTQALGGVSVARKIYVPADDGFARWLTTISNPGGAARVVTVGVSGNLGSDAGTTLGATSSGDMAASAGDDWVVTYGAFTQDSSREPRLAHVLSSTGASAMATGVQFATGDDTPAWAYQVSVPAGGSVSVLYFAAATQTVADAALKGAFLAALPPTATACLSAGEQAGVVNMVPGVVPSAPAATGTAALAITSPTVASTFNAAGPFLSIGGTAGSSGLQSVSWSNSRGGSGAALGLTSWMVPAIRLESGTNVITVTATYSSGVITDTLTVSLTGLTYMLPEGATGSFFTTDILIANPNAVEADATITFLKGDGTTVTLPPTTLAPTSRTTLRLNGVPGVEDTGAVSTVVSTATATPLVVERTMFWDGTNYGSHGAMAQSGPRTTFLFGEGAQGFFDTYLLLANAGDQPANVTVRFLREGETAITRSYEVAPTSRFNVYAGAIAELSNRAFSMAVDSDQPITAERAMYFGSPMFNAGHDSEGATIASPRWQFAEGASGNFFDTYFLLGNASPRTATVNLTFQLPNGTTVPVTRTVPPFGRTTIFADNEAPALADTAFSLSLVSSEPITAERSMYWAGSSTGWYEAHNALGVVEPATRWGLAEGRVGMADNFETFVLVGNANTDEAVVRFTFLRQSGGTVVRTYTIDGNSRFNLFVNAMVPELRNEEFGVVVDVLEGGGVTVERSMYHSSGGEQFRGGTATPAMRLP